jgi:hypothetical protein
MYVFVFCVCVCVGPVCVCVWVWMGFFCVLGVCVCVCVCRCVVCSTEFYSSITHPPACYLGNHFQADSVPYLCDGLRESALQVLILDSMSTRTRTRASSL